MEEPQSTQELADFAKLAKGDPWAAGDFLLKRFPEAEYPATKAKTSLYSALERYGVDVEQATGERLSLGTLRHLRATALAWDHGDRSPSATWKVHADLRGASDRKERLAGYVRRAQRQGRQVATAALVKMYRDEGKPTAARTDRSWQERVRVSVGQACRKVVLGGVIPSDPQRWWTAISDSATRTQLAAELEALAKAIRD